MSLFLGISQLAIITLKCMNIVTRKCAADNNQLSEIEEIQFEFVDVYTMPVIMGISSANLMKKLEQANIGKSIDILAISEQLTCS